MRDFIKRLLGFHNVLFCDLDKTLIQTKSGNEKPIDTTDWQMRWNVIYAIDEYRPKYIFIITNQKGIGRGEIKREDFQKKIREICNLIRDNVDGAMVEARICTSIHDDNPYRKPNTGMIDAIRKKHPFRNWQALMIGDASGKAGDFSDSDRKTAENAGIRYIDVEEFVEHYKL